MTAGDALHTYGILTIGDGLVSNPLAAHLHFGGAC